MSPEMLLKHFDRIADTPNAVPRLRRFILDLAVRGKLVEQNTEDEPAAELLKRIEEKKRLSETDKLRIKMQPLQREQIPFAIPTNWTWTQLYQIGVINPKNEAEDLFEASFVPMPMIFSEYGHANQHEIRSWSEIKKGFTHFAEGDVGLAKITPCFENGKSTVFRNLTGAIGAGTTELHIVRPVLVVPDYILLFLKSPYFIETGIPKMTGTAGQKRVPKDYFSFSPFPLPPLAEQHRIVAKVNELMALCDEMEAAQTKRERRRDHLVAATLHGMNNGKTDLDAKEKIPFEESARFYFNHLPRLTTRPEHIQQLRQTILNLAMRGKLVEQNPGDEPAKELLIRIEEKKKRLIKESKIRKQQPLSEISNNEIPFQVPARWEWTRAGKTYDVRDGTHDTPKYVEVGIPLVTSKNLRNGMLSLSDVKYISEKDHEEISRRSLVEKYDVLFAMIGTIANPVIVKEEPNFSIKNVALFKYYSLSDCSPEFLRYALLNFSKIMVEQATGGLQPFVSLGYLRNYCLPIPPLAEQLRIVAKVDELMALCDELETQITTTTITRYQFLEATLNGVLNGSAQLHAYIS